MGDEQTLSLLTYNIWFDEYRRIQRLESLLAIIQVYNPDIICLQEVVPAVGEVIKANLEHDYKLVHPEQILNTYGCMILSKLKGKTRTKQFDTRMGRELLIIDIEVNGKKISVGTMHYESEFGDQRILKYKQYVESESHLSLSDNTILAADTNSVNSRDEREFKAAFRGWKDSWTEKTPGYTYDYETNENIQYKTKRKYQSRLDRIMYRGDIKLVSTEIIKGFDGMVDPSDHHGLLVYFSISKKD